MKIALKQYSVTTYDGTADHQSGKGIYMENGVANNINTDAYLGTTDNGQNFKALNNDSIWGLVSFGIGSTVANRAIAGSTYRHNYWTSPSFNYTIRDAINDRTYVGTDLNFGHMYSRREIVDVTTTRYYRNGVEWSNRGGFTTGGLYITHRAANQLMMATYLGGGDGFDHVSFNTNLWLAINELEIAKVGTYDWDVSNSIHDWSFRELTSYQLDKLVEGINTNCDSITTGRVLNLVGHPPMTLNAQIQIDDMVNNKNWTVILI